MSLQQWLADRADERASAGLARQLHPRGPEHDLLDLAGNDYLGMATHPKVVEGAAEAARTWGAGATASRLVTGTLDLHAELEDELAAFCGRPAALVMSTGYHANLSVVTALVDKDTLIVSDAHVHASLVDACRMSRARVEVVTHNDVDAVADALLARTEKRALVLVESIYSVLGDAAPILELAAICGLTDSVLIVDEAHAIGVGGTGGRGLVHSSGLATHPRVIVSMTLSKALGSQGGAIVGQAELVEHLVNRARPFIYDTGLAPPAAGAALAALRLLNDQPDLPERALAVAARFAEAAGVPAPAGAVLSTPMPGPAEALEAQERCAREGIRVGCFRPPSVPDGISRLRITASARLGEAEVDRACAALKLAHR
jgi:8-amino-7-oxononanoate synthase